MFNVLFYTFIISAIGFEVNETSRKVCKISGILLLLILIYKSII